MVVVSEPVLSRYRAFSLYNSPYPSHAEGCAIDLYPGDGAPSPVAGEVIDTRTVRAPPRPYAAEDDHLIVVDAGERLARMLHVDPAVRPGDTLSVGDPLGELVRSGYFAPWVDNHVHLGFRPRDANPYRASGSLRIEIDAELDAVAWDGTGRVIERGETYVVLDEPGHPDPGARFAGIAAGSGVLDGGLAHYEGGGLFGGADGPVRLADERVGEATNRTVTWDDVEIYANGEPITGLSLVLHRDRLGVKLVSWGGVPAEVGERVEVAVRRP